jgi:signal peptidase I
MFLRNFILGLVAPGSAQISAGHVRRGILWAALSIPVGLTTYFTPWLMVAFGLAQIVDAVRTREGDPPEPMVKGLAMALCCFVFVGGAMLRRAYFVDYFRAPSGSMIPALLVGEHFAVDKMVHHARRGDIVVFPYPKEPEKDFVKRVIAVGGDTIEIRDDVIILDGKPVPRVRVEGDCSYDDYFEDRWEKKTCEAWDETLDGRTYRVVYEQYHEPRSWAPRTIPAGSFFVMGDNRDNSHDSRYWGAVEERTLKGRVSYIWWSRGKDGIRWDRLQKSVP